MSMITIQKLEQFKAEDQEILGEYSYCSSYKYAAAKEESDLNVTLRLELIELAEPYEKQYVNEPDDYERFEQVVPLGYSFGAFRNGKLIAAAIVEPQHWNRTLEIWSFQVTGSEKRKQVGTKLMNAVLERAKEEEWRAVVLETQNTNAPAIRFYRSCGFEIEGIDLSLYSNKDMDEGEVAIYMKKKLNASLQHT